ncbi:MAG: SDR family NAD(P)-dependent oxidoreductase [Candidatus Nanohaloarchaea archaeon]|nr:SDR family NAD(P)-dependent oxidoreductase [Candidatus Nanohaloarchaea archaeon]
MRAFITGAGGGIGRATEERLLADGQDVIAYDTDDDGLAELPDEVATYRGDVADRDRVDAVIDQEEFDVLVNNAGYQALGAVEDMGRDELQQHLETNLVGMWTVTRAALPMLRVRDGRIVNISSLAGRIAAPFWAAYAASKHAVEGFSDALRMEVADHGVDVVIVEPGPVRTGFNEAGRDTLRAYLPDSLYSDRYRAVLDRRLGGASPETAGKTVARAATASRPSARYTVTWQAWLAPKLACLLPARVMDRLVRRSR